MGTLKTGAMMNNLIYSLEHPDKYAFEFIRAGLPVQHLSDRLQDMPNLWNEILVRQSFPSSPHHSTQTIFLRGPEEFTAQSYTGDLHAVDYPCMDVFRGEMNAILRPILNDNGVRMLGYVMLVKLLPGSSVDEHIDEGYYADNYTRHHIVISSAPGNSFSCGGVSMYLGEGTCWRFNHKLKHSCYNGSETDRIHLIFDVM